MLTAEQLQEIERLSTEHGIRPTGPEVRELVKMARRYAWTEKNFRVFGLYISGKHAWVPTGAFSRIRGATLSEAIDQAIEGERNELA